MHANLTKFINDARIALIDFPLELKNPEIDTKISISSPEQLQGFLNQEERLERLMLMLFFVKKELMILLSISCLNLGFMLAEEFQEVIWKN